MPVLPDPGDIGNEPGPAAGLYGATFVFSVPAGGTGSWTIPLDPSRGNFVTDEIGFVMPTQLIGMQITVPKTEIPTISEWGMVIMALMLLVGARVYFGRHRAIVA